MCICIYVYIPQWNLKPNNLLIKNFPLAQLLKNLPAMQENQVWFLGWEDPLENEMATHSSILAWKIP